MTRSRLVALGITVSAVVLTVIPASANHAVPVTIQIQSTYAGTCGGRPGPNNTMPAGFTSALAANRLAGGNTAVPADLGSGPASAACTFNTSDPVWTAATPRHLTNSGTPPVTCNATTFTDCAGVHLPGFGPPARPGRFLNFSLSPGLSGGLPDPKNECRIVTSTAPFAAPCASIAIGYFEQGDSTLGGYCGSSEGFFWSITSLNSGMTENLSTPYDDVGFTIGQWRPNSAGSILPIMGSTTGTNWSTTTNGHYGGVSSSTPGAREWTGTKNVFALSSARSYVAAVDNEPTDPGSCSGAANFGGKQFLNQSVAISLGD